MKIERIIYSTVESPIGEILVTADECGIRSIYSLSHEARVDPFDHWTRDDAKLRRASDQLRAYFAGELREFSLTLNPQGTAFCKYVWKHLEAIPYGTTISYGDLARMIGKPTASRAVGSANANNPISFVVPCHRVIGHKGSLVGYGGGLELKRWLIEFEKGQFVAAKADKPTLCSTVATI